MKRPPKPAIVLGAAVWIAAGLPGGAATAADRWDRVLVIAPLFPVADHRLLDLDSDRGLELLVVGEQGEVRTWGTSAGGAIDTARPSGSLVLAEPGRSVLAIADILQTGGAPQLVVASPAGVEVFRPGPGGGLAEGEVLARRARFKLRVGVPTFVDIVQDVNNDGRPDLVLPVGDFCELWLNDGPRAGLLGEPAGLPSFRRTARISVRVARARSTSAEALSDQLESSFTIPRLQTRDVNGDGRPDLVVEDGRRRGFHLQRADATFPAEPDVTLDLDLFRDTTPEATLRPGRTLAGSDRARLEIRDLDDDGIADYVIAHRRKVWVFHGTEAGPQFTEPSTVLKVADDVTALLLPRLDDDPYPDLFLLKVQVPTVATLIFGLVGEWDVEISAVGYPSREGRSFATTPAWRGDLIVRLPALLGVIKNPDALLSRFDEVGRKFRTGVRGDFDGDGTADQLLVSENRARIDFWKGQSDVDAGFDEDDLEAALRQLFFEEENRLWDLDRILEFIAGFAEERATRMTGGRPPDGGFALRPVAGATLRGVDAGDLDGDGRDEAVVTYRLRDSLPTTVFDVVSYR